MSMHSRIMLAALLLPGVLWSCAPPAPVIRQPVAVPTPTPAPHPAAPPTEAVPLGPREHTAREAEALALMHQGDLARALIRWEILLTLAPEDPEYLRQVSATRALIRHRVATHLQAGERAAEEGDGERAKQEYLRALALDPRDRDSLARLRELERERILGVQFARLQRREARIARQREDQPGAESSKEATAAGNGQESDYLETGIALFKEGAYEESILEIRKYLGTYPSDRNALDYLERAQTELQRAGTPASTGNSQTGKNEDGPAPPRRTATAVKGRSVDAEGAGPGQQEQAQQLYEKGLRVYRSDLDQAISFWEQSLLLDPQHTQARLKLDQAYRMRDRLQQIRGQ